MKWFGESWGAPVCAQTPRATVPVGDSCMRCGATICEDDRGLLLPFRSDGVDMVVPFHLSCFLATISPA